MDSIEEIIRSIRQVAIQNGATKAILFGSFARGTATSRSDIDVIFIEKNSEKKYLKRLDKYFDPLVSSIKTSTDVFVYTEQEFDSMKTLPFIKKAIEEGIVVYEQ